MRKKLRKKKKKNKSALCFHTFCIIVITIFSNFNLNYKIQLLRSVLIMVVYWSCLSVFNIATSIG